MQAQLRNLVRQRQVVLFPTTVLINCKKNYLILNKLSSLTLLIIIISAYLARIFAEFHSHVKERLACTPAPWTSHRTCTDLRSVHKKKIIMINF
jgi:hypothetical protein